MELDYARLHLDVRPDSGLSVLFHGFRCPRERVDHFHRIYGMSAMPTVSAVIDM